MTTLTRYIAVFVIAMMLESACADDTSQLNRNDSAPPQLKLYVLQCGMMDMSEWAGFEQIYGTGKDSVSVPKQANPCFLVTHGNKSLLWDAGFPDSTQRVPHISEHGVYESMPVKLTEQLAAIGFTPSSVDYLALSHLHFDHVGNVGLFLKSTILMREVELGAVYGPDGEITLGYKQATLTDLNRASKLKMLEGNYDVFGDGSVVLIPAPGHTAGSQIMLVRLKNHGNIILSGDTVHFQEEFDGKFSTALNRDQDQARKTLRMIKELMAKERAEFWIQHDPTHYNRLKLAPAFYD